MAVTEDMLKNQLKNGYKGLKDFVQMLNAEMGGEAEEEKSLREDYQEELGRLLKGFGETEVTLLKQIQCLKKVEQFCTQNSQVNHDTIDSNTLMRNIKNIINLIQDKSRSNDSEPVLQNQTDEDRMGYTVKMAQEYLANIHPLELEFEDDDDDEENEQERNTRRLLEKLKKNKMNLVGAQMGRRNDMDVDEDTTEDEEDDDRVEVANHASTKAKRNQEKEIVERKFKELWNSYKEKKSNFVVSNNLAELYERELANTENIPLERLPMFSEFNESIFKIFNEEASIVSEKQNYKCPFSKMNIRVVIRNKICGHLYDKNSALHMLNKSKRVACPFVGCNCRSFTIDDLEEDEELTQKMERDLSRNQKKSVNDSNTNIQDIEDTDGETDEDN